MKLIQILSRIKIIILVAFTLLNTSCVGDDSTNENLEVTLAFNAQVGSTPFSTETRYHSPNSDGEYRIDRFKLYISNVKFLTSSGHVYQESDSYHLLNFQGQTVNFTTSVPLDNYTGISFLVGIDEEANKRIDHTGDLDPTNDMVWDWVIGYKFLLLEGNYFPESTDQNIGLVFHVGFDESVRILNFSLDELTPQLNFIVDINQLFSSVNAIDFHTVSNVISDKGDVKLIADNYGDESFIKLVD